MSIFDDPGYDLDGDPAKRNLPVTERRGGRAVDWDAVQPGEELPELQDTDEDS